MEKITTKQISPELKEVAHRYAQKTQIANYMRPTAFGAFIDGALYAQGKYISLHDKEYRELKNNWID